MIPALIGGAIALGSAYLGYRESKKNRELQRQQNEKDRAWQQQQYNQQRADALKDLDTMNSYNSPVQQMNRLRQAGLSPHLVYGKGADTTAVMARASSSTPSSQPAEKQDNKWFAPALEHIQGGITQGLQNKQIQAQTDNLYEQNSLLKKESILKEATTAKTLSETASNKFQLEQAQRIKDQIFNKVRLENASLAHDILKKQADTTFTLDANERAKVMQSYNIKKTLQDIMESKMRMAKTEAEKTNIQATWYKIQQDIRLGTFTEEMHKMGLTPSDPLYQRYLAELFKTIGGNN